MRNKTANIYTEWLPLIESQPDNEAGVIFKSILKYQNGEDVTCNNPVWLFIKSKLNDYNNKGEEISKTNSTNAKKRWDKKNATVCDGINRNANDAIKEKKRKQNKTKEEKKEKINKKEYGEFKNVLLSDDEYQKLFNIYFDKLDEAIEYLSSKIKSNGYEYKDFYAVMGKTNWVYKNIMEKNPNNPVGFKEPKKDNLAKTDEAIRKFLNKSGE